jgi:hypothetical protein
MLHLHFGLSNLLGPSPTRMFPYRLNDTLRYVCHWTVQRTADAYLYRRKIRIIRN